MEEAIIIPTDSTEIAEETLSTPDTTKVKKNFIEKAYGFVKELFFEVDPRYIFSGDHNFQAMMYNSNTYETYRITDADGNSVRFSPTPTMNIGPYIGYGPIFIGWTVDMAHMKWRKKRTNYSISLYSLPIGIDLYYQSSGENFRVRDVKTSENINTAAMKNKPFEGFSSRIVGFNAYYIFNNNRFSYPAGFNESTVQLKNAGSWLAGIGYKHHSLSVDWKKLNTLSTEVIGHDISHQFSDMQKITYTDVSLSCGYGYNWVFAKNWMFASSLSLALAYKHSASKTLEMPISFHDFSFDNINIDAIGRFGIVWNYSRWFVGANLIVNSYNYKKPNFYTNSAFGSLNIYAGVNFW